MRHKTEQDAIDEAKYVLTLMKTKGWEYRIWRNMGWHWVLKCGYLRLSISHPRGNYYCRMNDQLDGRGSSFYHAPGFYEDPNQAIEEELSVAKKSIDKLKNVLDEQNKFLNPPG